MYLAQSGIALFTGLLVALLGDPAPARASALGPVLVALAVGQCGLGLLLPDRLARSGERGSVLSAALLSAVLLSTPVWFLLLALLSGQTALVLLALGLMVATGYALGFVLTGRLARRVRIASVDGAGGADAVDARR
jgi:hypothetical protein